MQVRKILVPVIAFVLTLSGVTFTPAQAALPANGKYDCNTGLRTTGTPNYTISIGVVEEGRSCVGNVVIPSGVTKIGENAFYYATEVESVVIPASVTTIEWCAFQAAFSLAAVTFATGSKLKVIEGYAFQSTSLQSISIPASVTTIGDGAFFGASSLESITIPAGIGVIERDTFRDATSLHTINFASGSKLNEIGDRAFKGATSITSITIPSSVNNINEESFANTSSLTAVTFAPKSELSEIGYGAFTGSGIVSITLPAEVSDIGEAAFFSASQLQTVFLLSNNAVRVGSNAFSGTAANAEIAVAPTSPKLANHFFRGWSTKRGGGAVSFPYAPSKSSAIVLYAKWTIDPVYAAAVKDLAARTFYLYYWPLTYQPKYLAEDIGLKAVSSKATVSIKVSSSSKKICTKSGSKLKVLKPGNCVVTFTIQGPKPKGGKKPKAKNINKTLVFLSVYS